jgi:hypothetical protein
VTRYGPEGSGFEPKWGARFSAPVQTDHEYHPASYKMDTGSFPGVKWPGRGVDHTPPSSSEVKERVELFVHSPSLPSWPLNSRTLSLLLVMSNEGQKHVAGIVQGDQKVCVHLMITIQKVTSNVQSVPRQSPDIY